MEYKVYGYLFRVAIVGCLASAAYCLSSVRPVAYWRLDPEYGPWKSCIWVVAAFLAWCAARYSFNRAAARPANKLDLVLFTLAWILIALPFVNAFVILVLID
jgi:hypothetical protein